MTMGQCAHCERPWHSAYMGELVRPVVVPIDEDGAGIMTVCETCASQIPTELIAAYARLCYDASTRTMYGTATPSSEAESAIASWQKETESRISQPY